jgi:hypothetical protein
VAKKEEILSSFCGFGRISSFSNEFLNYNVVKKESAESSRESSGIDK